MWQELAITMVIPFTFNTLEMAKITPAVDNVLQEDMEKLYNIIDKSIDIAKHNHKIRVNIQLNDPEYFDKTFSIGFSVIIVLIQNHYINLDYKINTFKEDDNLIIQIN